MQTKATKGFSISHSFDVQRTELDNGLIVVSEKVPHVRSVSFGVFLRSGSRHETIEQHGLTHFIEHALFKGTRKRSAAQIAAEADALGGNLDAFTGREIVGFYDKVLDEHLPRAFDLVADLVTAPAFDPAELDKERNVILEEIKMVEDTPDDVIFDIFCENFYRDHALGRPILGTEDSLETFKRSEIQAWYDEIYRPDNFVFAAAGNLDHEGLIGLANEYFGELKPRGSQLTSPAPNSSAPVVSRHKAELEQSHLVIGAPCPSLVSEDRYVANILSVILGGGMSSRLFQSIREDKGLVYTVFSSVTPFKDCGYLNIYAATSTDQLHETIDAVMEELKRIKGEPVSEEELRRNKDQLKASLMLNLESTSSRMSALAQHEMNFGRFISPDEVIEGVEAVTAEDIERLANEIFRAEAVAATVLGDLVSDSANGSSEFTLDHSCLLC
ncbi:MAG: M16 family metallopeptidase [Blastocatellales bacterium]